MNSQKNRRSRIWVLVFAFLVQFSQSAAFNAVNSHIVSYGSFLGMSAMHSGILTGLTFVSSLLTRPVAGPLQMRFDRRKILITVFIAGILLQSGYLFIHNPTAVVIIRFFGGMQAATFSSLAFTIAAENLPPDLLVQGLGIFGLAPAIGGAVGPAAAARLFSRTASGMGRAAGYQRVFLLAEGLLAVGFAASLLMAPQPPVGAPGETDRKWYQNITERRVFWPAVIILLVFMPYTVLNSYIVPYVEERGLPGISYFFLVFAGSITGSRPLANNMEKRRGIRTTLLIGLGIFAFALIGLCFARDLPMVLILAVLAAAGFGCTQPGCQALAIQSVHPGRKPLAVTGHYIGIDIGSAAGPVLFGGMVYPMTGSYGQMFLLSSIPLLLAAVVLYFYWPSFCERREEYFRLQAFLLTAPGSGRLR